MDSVIFRTVSTWLFYLLHIVALWLLYRGHNLPGGGFVAGLVSGSAFALKALAYDFELASPRLRRWVMPLGGIGLALAFLSGLFSFWKGWAFLTGLWGKISFRVFGKEIAIPIGSPQLFDLGVYFVVMAVVIGILFNLLEFEKGAER